MADLGLVQAFARYGAKLKNPQWSVCALAANGDLVVSLWEHHRTKGDPGTLEFSDTVNRWSGPGNNEFRAALKEALESGRPLRLVMAHAEDPGYVETGADASKTKKTFSVRPELIGKVVSFNDESYVISFVKELK
jgi:hypothetical protein